MYQPIFAQSDSFLKDELLRWENARIYTLQVAQLMPENAYDFKPTVEEMAFSAQLTHLSDNMLWLSSSFLTNAKPTVTKQDFEGKSKKEMILLTESAFDFVKNALENFDANDLSEEITFAGQKISKRRIIMLINDHLTHHRAQMIVYLRLKDIKPPKYVGW